MQRVQCLHLKHVLQTVCALEAVVLRTFGPEGGQVLFTRDTGQVMLSRSGTQILTALRLEHPLARMVVECIWKHTRKTGDGSKSFILLVASLLRTIHSAASKEPIVSCNSNSRAAAESTTARHLADKMLGFTTEKLEDLITVALAPYGVRLLVNNLSANALTDYDNLQKLLVSFFCTRLGCTHCDLMSELICKLLISWKCFTFSSLRFLNDNFPALHTAVLGFPVSCSRLIAGQVIHRDFATPHRNIHQHPVKAVVFTISLQPKLLNAEDVLELETRMMEDHGDRPDRMKQSDAALALATQAEMCVVECVSEDELALFIHLSGASPVSDCRGIQPEHVASLTFCQPILLGAHRYVHVDFPDSKEDMAKPSTVVICGLGEGQTNQYARAIEDVIRMLRTTWEPLDATTISVQSGKSPSSILPGCVLPTGGTFEFLLHHALLQYGKTQEISNPTDTDVPLVCQLLADALLCLPRHIYSDNLRCFLQVQTRVCSFDPYEPDRLLCMPEFSQAQEEPCMYSSSSNNLKMLSGLESVSCKYHLIMAVLQCVKSLLRVDTVLHVSSDFNSKPARPTYSSDDED
ncbi:Bardet-Biedl syndrome 10 protein isoform X2 [Dunckerocampus dactyliophorus]|uniref:Bardet-Biedl syndrome 10 protein isoform X2 n=1 Tax=Dunckerocampus dactyliophorus TaxID=161453 RepID=UPI0024076446|nr:Bardet-Biedl syndrome 10 protein isoform X2 [Dunckerocampus dactyliophorus]